MQTYSLYHLDHQNVEHRQQIKELISTIPKLDESLIRQYCSSRKKELQIRDAFIEVGHAEFVSQKCQIVNALLQTSAYSLVAKVKAHNIVDVVTKTNSINCYWFMKKLKNISLKSLSERDTRSYDVIKDDEKIYLVNGVGFIDVNKQCIFNYDEQ